eukprot:SM000048S16497  [mRNA]  locus=s48:68330:69267:+ [translate_table: standard]
MALAPEFQRRLRAMSAARDQQLRLLEARGDRRPRACAAAAGHTHELRALGGGAARDAAALRARLADAAGFYDARRAEMRSHKEAQATYLAGLDAQTAPEERTRDDLNHVLGVLTASISATRAAGEAEAAALQRQLERLRQDRAALERTAHVQQSAIADLQRQCQAAQENDAGEERFLQQALKSRLQEVESLQAQSQELEAEVFEAMRQRDLLRNSTLLT